MIRWLWLLMVCLATPVLATQDAWPATYSVTGVAADDVLNVRAGPGADTAIVGTLAHDATAVEVIRPNGPGTWGLINTGEGTGWVSLRYLARDPGQWYGAAFPITACFGTEPFWDLSVGANWHLTRLGDETLTLPAAPLLGALAHRDRHLGTSQADTGEVLTLVTVAQSCNDGMSDRAYGISASVLVGQGANATLLAGCCTLSR